MTTILVADDIEENRYLLVVLLKGSGYDVVTAGSGVEALQSARTSPPDLVVTDVLMPGMDGFELCRRWRQDERLKHIPFVVYTATYTDPKDERLALGLGANRFLVKPQKPEAFLQVLREVLDTAARDPDSMCRSGSDDEFLLLKEHNEALVHKLGKKVRELEAEVVRRGAVEAELRESERRFRLLAENTLDVVWSMGFDGRFTYVSPAVEKLQGFTPAEALELPLGSLIGPGALAVVEKELARARADMAVGCPLDRSGLFEFELPRRDGSTVWAEVSASVMSDEQDRPIGVLGVTRNIHARKRAEEEARRASEGLARKTRELEALLDGAQAILAGQDFPTTARRIFDNARALTGAQAGYVALLSGSGEENELVFLETGGLACAVDSTLPMPIRGLRGEVYRTGEIALDNAFMSGPWVAHLPQGHVELQNVLFAPLNVEGKTIGIMGLANKATPFDDDDKHAAAALAQLAAVGLQRWRAEQMLRESESLQRIAGRMAHLGGWCVNMQDRRVRWSDEVAAIHEMPAGHVPPVEEGIQFYAPEWQSRIRAAFDACALEGKPYDEEMEIITAGGKRIWVRTVGQAIRDASGMIGQVQGAFQDITDRKQAETAHQNLQRQLLESQKIESIGRLAGGVAHDFNNLLLVILSYAGFAISNLREGDPLRADIEEIRSAAERAAALTRQLLAFSRRQVLQPAVISLNNVIVDLESMLRRLLGEDVEIDVRLAGSLGSVKADSGQIEQVIMNLAVNARDAMPQGGKLTLETANVDLDASYALQHVGAQPGPYVLLSVTDTGTGMDAATKERVFEPFFTTKELGKGTGLGLSTVHGIVKQSGGSIWLYSEPGRGTTFKIYLPRIDVAPTEAGPRSLPVTVRGCETVLVVENEDAVRRITERILHGAGYQVLAASSGGEALFVCEKHGGAIELLLTDVVMPQMGGRELADRVAKLKPGIKVLYMSGFADGAIVHNGVLDPGMRFIGKPFSANDLARMVREVLDESSISDA